LITQKGADIFMEKFFRILNLEPGASTSQIKEAFRKKIKTLHPDVNPDPAAGEEFIRVYEAYQVLLKGVAPKPAFSAPGRKAERPPHRHRPRTRAEAVEDLHRFQARIRANKILSDRKRYRSSRYFQLYRILNYAVFAIMLVVTWLFALIPTLFLIFSGTDWFLVVVICIPVILVSFVMMTKAFDYKHELDLIFQDP
jgi:hypothetical protein